MSDRPSPGDVSCLWGMHAVAHVVYVGMCSVVGDANAMQGGWDRLGCCGVLHVLHVVGAWRVCKVAGSPVLKFLQTNVRYRNSSASGIWASAMIVGLCFAC